MFFFVKKIYYSIFEKNYNYTKTLINLYFTNKKKTIVAFSDHGGGTKYIQNEQFFRLTKKYNVLFVRDTSRSWFNNLDTELIKKNIKNKTCYAIGNSMGAFNAIIFSNLHNIKKVIAFSPQFSIHPNISDDKDFINHAARIKKWKFPHVFFSKKTKYLLIFGDDKKERYHASLMPKLKNIKVVYIKNSNHLVAQKLKSDNKLYKIINSFFC
jgi:hypothetical protein